MAQHIILGTTDPATAPTRIGQHYVNTATKKQFISVGTDTSADWSFGGGLSEAEVQALIDSSIGTHEASLDPHPQYLTTSEGDTRYDTYGAANGVQSNLNTHASNTSNPHSVTKTQVGLGNVPNIDATQASNITQDATHRFVSDTEKTTWNSKYDSSNPNGYQTASQVNTAIQNVIGAAPAALDTLQELANALGNDSNYATTVTNALAGKEPSISTGGTSAYWRGDKTWQTLNSSAVGLGNVPNVNATNPSNIIQDSTHRFITDTERTNWNAEITNLSNHVSNTNNPHAVTKLQIGLGECDNTSDLNKPISTATQNALNLKEPILYASWTGAYYRGDKTWATLDKSAVGLSNIDNTSDLSKPISNATQSALDLKSDITHTHAVATTSTDGFMSAADKTKLDSVTSEQFLRSVTRITNTSNTTFASVTELSIPVTAGKLYSFKFTLVFDTAATNRGVGLSLMGTSSGNLTSVAEMPISNTGGTANKFSGPINAMGTVITSTAVGAANTWFIARVEGLYLCSGSGVFYPYFRSEVNGSQVAIEAGSIAEWKEY